LYYTDESDSEGGGGGDPDGDHDDLASIRDNPILNDPKLGAKKRAKLEAKLEKKAHREVRAINYNQLSTIIFEIDNCHKSY